MELQLYIRNKLSRCSHQDNFDSIKLGIKDQLLKAHSQYCVESSKLSLLFSMIGLCNQQEQLLKLLAHNLGNLDIRLLLDHKELVLT